MRMADKFKGCSIENCAGNSYCKGYCRPHYLRLWRYGDTRSGTPLKGRGTQIRFIESAIAHRSDECLNWPYSHSGDGYGQVCANGKRFGAHRYVCAQVHGAPPTPKHEAAHSCGNSSCVNPRHLSWKTHRENEADKLIHGTHSRGEKNYNAKLTEAQVREILSLRGKENLKEIAARFGVRRSQIYSIYSGKTWAWLDARAAA